MITTCTTCENQNRRIYNIIRTIPMPTTTLQKPVLRFGASGKDVQELQTLLRGYAQFIGSPAINPGPSDGIFGETTRLAVLAFQNQVFIPTTGIVADLTWRSLFKRAPVDLPNVKFGETSDYVEILETRLVALGYLAAPANRVYDRRTLDALSNFQRAFSLPQKSTVDEAMWFALSKIPVGSR
jgi:peptidoglycan hydrolase-like protein with peptidoglycan-binding domain